MESIPSNLARGCTHLFHGEQPLQHRVPGTHRVGCEETPKRTFSDLNGKVFVPRQEQGNGLAEVGFVTHQENTGVVKMIQALNELRFAGSRNEVFGSLNPGDVQ